MRRDGAVLQDILIMVDIMEEKIQGGDALDEPGLEVIPLLAGDNPGHHVERENALSPLGVPVNVERNALPQKR